MLLGIIFNMNYYHRLLPLAYIWFTISLNFICLFIYLINICQASRYLEMVFHRYLLNEYIQCAGTVLISETWHIYDIQGPSNGTFIQRRVCKLVDVCVYIRCGV